MNDAFFVGVANGMTGVLGWVAWNATGFCWSAETMSPVLSNWRSSRHSLES